MPTPPFIFYSGHKKSHNAFYRIFNTALDFSLFLCDLSRLRRLLAWHCWLAHPGDKLDQKLFPDSSDPQFPDIFLTLSKFSLPLFTVHRANQFVYYQFFYFGAKLQIKTQYRLFPT